MRLSSPSTAILMALACMPAARAQTAIEDQERHEGPPLEEIVVTANPVGRSRFETLQGTSVVTGEKLEQSLSATIGETLAGLPGISQTAFGQGASRPVIRGLGGDRLRILINGISTFDVSTTSPDHAVAVDMSTAKRIEVVRGPATLIYGNNAIAGVVNVIDHRVPRDLPDGGLDGFVRGIYGSNSDETLFGGELDLDLGAGLVAHVDGFRLDTGDFEVPGFVRSAALRAEEPLGDGEEEVFGKAENSDQSNWGATGGLSLVRDWGFIGASVNAWEKNYGIPAELEEEEGGGDEEEEGGVRIDIEQLRFDMIGEVTRPFLIFDTTRLRFGYADYEQVELEGGDVGTVFGNDEWEMRLDFVQRQIGALSGSTGMQFRGRDFSAIGAEAFVPANDTFQWGLYSYQNLDLGPFRLEGGLRFDRQTISASPAAFAEIDEPDEDLLALGFDRGFTGVSVSGGVSWTLPFGLNAGISGFRNERAPNAEELLSGGPHLATFTFEIGDPTLGEETVKGVEGSIKRGRGPLTFALNGFFYSYDDFIFERFTGEVADGLDVAQFSAVNAKFYGFEIETGWEAWSDGERALLFDFVFDVVEARERASKDPLPRISPLSATIGAEYRARLFDLRFESRFVDAQKDIAAFERPTDGYVDLTATLTLHPFPDRDIALILQGRNLADEDIRHHTSFLKDLVPAPGRDVRATLKAAF